MKEEEGKVKDIFEGKVEAAEKVKDNIEEEEDKLKDTI